MNLEKINVPFYKISSGDVNNLPLIQHIIKKKNQLFYQPGDHHIQKLKYNFIFKKKIILINIQFYIV